MRSRPLLSFFVLAFSVTWILQFTVLALGLPFTHPLALPLMLLAGIAPSLAALIISVRGGRKEVRRLWGPRGRIRGFDALLAFSMRTALVATAVLLCLLFDVGGPRFFFSPILLGTMIVAALGEEFGWRGFAYVRFAERIGPLRASVLVGAIWALWHLPTSFPLDDSFAFVFPLFVVRATAAGVIICWLYERAGRRIMSPILAHAGLNLAILQLPGSISARLISTAVWCVAAVLAGRALRGYRSA